MVDSVYKGPKYEDVMDQLKRSSRDGFTAEYVLRVYFESGQNVEAVADKDGTTITSACIKIQDALRLYKETFTTMSPSSA